MAATTIDELQVLITAQNKQFQKALREVYSQLSSLEKETQSISQRIPKSFKRIGTAAVALGSIISAAFVSAFRAVANLGTDAVKRLDILNNFPKTMSNLGVSADLSKKSIDLLSDKLTGLPTALDTAAMSVQRFTSANGSISASTHMFLALNNAILAGNAPMELQRTALEQLSQAYAKGKPDMMEWRSAMSAMPAQLKQIALSMGFVNADALGQSLREGATSMNDFMSTIIRLNKEGLAGFENFEQQARNSTGGVGTSIANMRIAFVRGLASIMDAIGQANISAFFNGIASAINAVIPYIIAFIKVIGIAIGWVRSLFGGGKSQADGMAKAAKSAAESVSSIGVSASEASDGIEDAVGGAKKLKKELAGLAAFDEMNVLKEPDASAGGGGGGASVGGGGVPDFSGLDFGDDLDAIDKISGKVKSILGFFEKIGEVAKVIWNSAPVQAFVGLVVAHLQFLWDFITQVGKALWDNLVGTWQIIEPNVITGIQNITQFFTQMWLDMTDAINTYSQPIIDAFIGFMDSVYHDAFEPAIVLISKIWADFTKTLLDTWEKYGSGILDSLGQWYLNVISLFKSVWDNVIAPIIVPFLEELSTLWEKHLKGMIDEVAGFVARLIQAALNIYNNFISPVARFLLTVLSPAFSFVGQLVSGVMGTVLGTIASVVKSIFGIFNGLIDFISGVFSGNWRKAWEGVKNIFKNIVSGLGAVIKTPINLIIDLINSFIAGINKVQVPSWVPKVGGKGINIPKIPKLAAGGVISSPGLFMAGEAGAEVIPIQKNTGWAENVADVLAEKINTNNQPTTIVVKVGEETLIEKIVSGINDLSFMGNETVLEI